jgi:hypothetical protein
MDEEFLSEALRLMLLSRQYDERVIGLQRQGRFSVYSPGLGQEAAIVGSAWDERQHSVSAKTYVADAALPGYSDRVSRAQDRGSDRSGGVKSVRRLDAS